MKRPFLLASFLLAAAAATGCCSQRMNTLADGFEGVTREIFVEYVRYVDADGRLQDSDKQIRKNSVIKAQELIDQARK